MQETTTSIEELRECHNDAMVVYHEIVASHLSSGKTYYAAQVADRMPKTSPKFYHAFGGNLGSKTWGRDPELMAVSYGYYERHYLKENLPNNKK